MNEHLVLMVLLLLWSIANMIWAATLQKKEGWVAGTIEMVDHLCDSIGRAFSFKLPGQIREMKTTDDDDRDDRISSTSEYTGVLHIFRRDGKKHERPIMSYQYRDKTCYYEIDEKGNRVALSPEKTRIAIESVLGGEKVDHYKKYDIEKK